MNDPCEGKYDIVPRLRDYINRDDNDIAEAAAYIERLRKERDEARREVCVWSCRVVRADRWMPTERVALGNEEDVAKSRGWDCFEDENK